LDRRSRAEKLSPAFTDLAMGAMLFLAYLTLKAWDIGGGRAAIPDARAVARVCAEWATLLGAATVAIRLAVRGARYFDFTAAALLQIALHGFAGLPWLVAGAVALALLAATLAWRALRAPRAPAELQP
jgi:hypothetical protein